MLAPCYIYIEMYIAYYENKQNKKIRWAALQSANSRDAGTAHPEEKYNN